VSANLRAPDHNWRTRGLCRDHPDRWTPTPPAGGASEATKNRHQLLILAVKAACIDRCEVIDQCRRDILAATEDRHAIGVVAGMDPADRRAARKEPQAIRGATEDEIRQWSELKRGRTWEQVAAHVGGRSASSIAQIVGAWRRANQQEEVAA
jgi:hypothetical protein